ncbi:hypothetical protein B9Z55_007334 [Caenorhabditis nigoni]|uniref:C-type lectin domain-containing protein n=2 Tax=Caenorhabditis nigoni TaxID=1611254 RepID=A0A2G5V932_9PELO|nr:hypothetical protein B9Z55_007334 [Caenorhabditis nigoni]
MCYYFLCFLSLSFLTVHSTDEPYMIRVSGHSKIFKGSLYLDTSWEKCIVVFKLSDIKCQFFAFQGISTVQESAAGGYEIALKIQLPVSKCPISNPLIPGPTYLTQTINNQLRTTTVSFDSKSKQYKLTYRVISCPENTKLFLRRGAKVCIGLFFFEDPRCNNYAQASALCKAKNGTLTGPANADEYKYIQNISNSSNYTSNPDSFDYLTYWIDGAGTNTAYTFEDPTHDGTTNYQWAEGVSRSKAAGQCLHNPNPLHVNISEYPCTATFLVKAVCWRGALCQIPPIIE